VCVCMYVCMYVSEKKTLCMHVLNCMCYFLLLAIKIHSAFLLHEKLLETYSDTDTSLLTAECSFIFI